MRKLQALLYKDSLLLLRDISGLAMMFLMPLVLVVLMTLLQDSTFSSVNESGVPILLINEDDGMLGELIEKQLSQSDIFRMTKTLDGQQPTAAIAEKAVAEGKFLMAIIVPKDASKHIQDYARRYVAYAFNNISGEVKIDTVHFRILIDPTTKSSFRSTIMSTVREYATRIEADLLFKEITKEVNRVSPVPIGDVEIKSNIVSIEETYASLKENSVIPNSVQHNVPAWTMFAIFFIVVSLSGNIIKEREDGSYTRLLTMPCPYYLYLTSKALVYLLVCMVQLLLILLTGIYIIPLFGLPKLAVAGNWVGVALVGISAALAAIGYGIAIGKLARSHHQASVFGSISVVILAAIGGVWIPVFIMPPLMQKLSLLSPLRWGLDGFSDIFVRGASWTAVLPQCCFLIIFFVACMSVAIIYNKKRIDS